MLQHLFSRYRAIEDIELKENAIKMLGPYSPDEPLSRLIEQLKRGREFSRLGGHKISNAMIMSKGITLMEQMGVFNDDIREWR